jgi:hypothetical protein
VTGRTVFEEKFGFRRDEVTLANWRTAPFSRWAFQNVTEIVPSVVQIYGQAQDEEPADAGGLLGEAVELPGGAQTVQAFLERTHTDALTIMRGGAFIADWSAPHTRFGTPHLAFSISKSLTAVIAGILEGDGLLDPDAPVIRYVPEAARSAYADATVRHVLDMTVGLDFEEAYLEPESVFARYRQAMLWNPGGNGESLLDLLCDLKRLPGPHGEVFRYRSPNSDMLGIIIERASGAARQRPDAGAPVEAAWHSWHRGRHGRSCGPRPHGRRRVAQPARSCPRRRDDAAGRRRQRHMCGRRKLGPRDDERRQPGGLAAQRFRRPASGGALPQQMVPERQGLVLRHRHPRPVAGDRSGATTSCCRSCPTG